MGIDTKTWHTQYNESTNYSPSEDKTKKGQPARKPDTTKIVEEATPHTDEQDHKVNISPKQGAIPDYIQSRNKVGFKMKSPLTFNRSRNDKEGAMEDMMVEMLTRLNEGDYDEDDKTDNRNHFTRNTKPEN